MLNLYRYFLIFLICCASTQLTAATREKRELPPQLGSHILDELVMPIEGNNIPDQGDELVQQVQASLSSLPTEAINNLLHVAVCGHEAITRLLLENGADVNSLSPEGFTPLYIAVRGGTLL